MIGQYLQSIEGIEHVALAMLLLCFGAFVMIVVRALRTDDVTIDSIARLPLEETSPVQTPEVHP